MSADQINIAVTAFLAGGACMAFAGWALEYAIDAVTSRLQRTGGNGQ